jgi:formylglycine-generating enzyme
MGRWISGRAMLSERVSTTAWIRTRIRNTMINYATSACALLMALACKPSEPVSNTGGSDGEKPGTGGGLAQSGGAVNAGGAEATGGTFSEPAPKYHPPPGFEGCEHAEVKADCTDGWCKLPPSCFVMGSPEDEWHRGRDSENRSAVNLTHNLEVQQKELTRGEWETITKTSAPGPDNCPEVSCPVAMVSWWDAVHAANLLSAQKELEPCYEPVDCTGSLGKDLVCTGVADPDKSVYECEGYRLPTRAEAEYAARAGTVSTFYSGDITVYADDTKCNIDPALELIAWYCWNSGNKPHPGGQLTPNGFGLYDMIGNLGEWSNETQLGESTPGGDNPRGLVGRNENRLRFSPQYDGDSYLARTAALLSATWKGRGNQGGFRLVRTLDPKP